MASPDAAHTAQEPNSSDDYIVTKTVYDPRLSVAGPIVGTIHNAGRIMGPQMGTANGVGCHFRSLTTTG